MQPINNLTTCPQENPLVSITLRAKDEGYQSVVENSVRLPDIGDVEAPPRYPSPYKWEWVCSSPRSYLESKGLNVLAGQVTSADLAVSPLEPEPSCWSREDALCVAYTMTVIGCGVAAAAAAAPAIARAVSDRMIDNDQDCSYLESGAKKCLTLSADKLDQVVFAGHLGGAMAAGVSTIDLVMEYMDREAHVSNIFWGGLLATGSALTTTTVTCVIDASEIQKLGGSSGLSIFMGGLPACLFSLFATRLAFKSIDKIAERLRQNAAARQQVLAPSELETSQRSLASESSMGSMTLEVSSLIHCPISFSTFKNSPYGEVVLASDGRFYDKQSLVSWLKDHDDTSPVSREKIVGYCSHPIIHEISQYLHEHKNSLAWDSQSCPSFALSDLSGRALEEPYLDAITGWVVEGCSSFDERDPYRLYFPIIPLSSLIDLS